jgi:hypothetical protein
MTALGVVYPQYWVAYLTIAKEIFCSHFNMLKVTFCNPCKIGGLDQDVLPLLSAHKLDL